MKYLSSTVAAGLGAALLAGSAGAQTPDAPPSPPDAEVASSSPRSGPLAVPYQRRYVPEANLWELGLFGGMMFPSSSHQLYDPALTSAVQQPFEPAGEIGVRFAYYPLAFLGGELEAAADVLESQESEAEEHEHPRLGRHAVHGESSGGVLERVVQVREAHQGGEEDDGDLEGQPSRAARQAPQHRDQRQADEPGGHQDEGDVDGLEKPDARPKPVRARGQRQHLDRGQRGQRKAQAHEQARGRQRRDGAIGVHGGETPAYRVECGRSSHCGGYTGLPSWEATRLSDRSNTVAILIILIGVFVATMTGFLP